MVTNVIKIKDSDKIFSNFCDGVKKISLFCRHQKGKQLLLFSLASWIVFTLPLGFIQPPATSCILRRNATDYVLKTPENPTRNLRRRREALVTSEGGELDVPSGIHSLSFLEDNGQQVHKEFLSV